MAFPAAIFIQRYTFKSGVLVGLALFALGSLLFLPAKMVGNYYPFLMAYFIMTCGLSFLETSCNPYVYCMGSEDTGIQRLNLAQAFNPIGAILGMYIAMEYVQSKMSPMTAAARLDLPDLQFNLLKEHDLSLLIGPYLFIGAITIVLFVLIRIKKMPTDQDTHAKKDLAITLHELMRLRNFKEGWLALFFYVGAQAGCWTYIIQYGTRVFLTEGMEEPAAVLLSQKYNIVAMLFFIIARFACTYIMGFVKPSRLLAIMGILGTVLLGGTILFPDRSGLYCLVCVSICLSLMFPTIYGISLHGTGDNVKFAGAGLVMAILGGSIFPPIQAMIIDSGVSLFGLASPNLSYIIPMICLIVVTLFGHHAYVRFHIMKETDEIPEFSYQSESE